MSENQEAADSGETKEQPKRGGRPRKQPDFQPTEPTTENGEKSSATEKSPATETEKPSAVVNSSAAPEGRIVQEDEEVEVDTETVKGTRIATETVYRQKRVPNSARTTYVLIASKGTRVE